jgi:tryptophanyl-tRNA synthetase
MSKSYGNFIEIFEPVKSMKKKVMRISTDSRAMEEAKEPETDHLFQLFSLFGEPAAIEEMAAMYRRGGFGYGDVKKALAEAAEKHFEPARERREEMAAAPEKVHEILNDGAAKARRKAGEVLKRAQQACGVKF